LTDALKIRNRVEFLVQSHRADTSKKLIRIVVDGGGFNGVELCAELERLLRIVAWKNSFPLEKIELMLIEGASQLLPGLSKQISEVVRDRLAQFGVEIRLQNLVCKVTDKQIFLSTEEVVNYDMFVWSGGVRAIPAPFLEAYKKDNHDRAIVDEFLHLCPVDSKPAFDSIFVIGDGALILDENKKPVPGTASQAIYQAGYVANLVAEKIVADGSMEKADVQTAQDRSGAAMIQSQKFVVKQFGFVVPVGGKWGALSLPNGFEWFGFLAWFGHRLIDLRYFSSIMPFSKAVKLLFAEENFLENRK